MTNPEFSNEFDILYNSISSNQSPGIDEYEKSVFLTMAQDDIIKSYFNPVLNKSHEGYDDNHRRQIDFSMITKVIDFSPIKVFVYPNKSINVTVVSKTFIELKNSLAKDNSKEFPYVQNIEAAMLSLGTSKFANIIPKLKVDSIIDAPYYKAEAPEEPVTIDPFIEPTFDNRTCVKAVALPSDILMILNERIIVNRAPYGQKELTVVPVTFASYDSLMSKPYKFPLKNQAWRLINNDSTNRVDLIVGPNDKIQSYKVRYIKRPRPIILDNAISAEDNLSIGGLTYSSTCELDEILHKEILERAVELALATYAPEKLTSMVAVGNASRTELGMVPQSSK